MAQAPRLREADLDSADVSTGCDVGAPGLQQWAGRVTFSELSSIPRMGREWMIRARSGGENCLKCGERAPCTWHVSAQLSHPLHPTSFASDSARVLLNLGTPFLSALLSPHLPSRETKPPPVLHSSVWASRLPEPHFALDPGRDRVCSRLLSLTRAQVPSAQLLTSGTA